VLYYILVVGEARLTGVKLDGIAPKHHKLQLLRPHFLRNCAAAASYCGGRVVAAPVVERGGAACSAGGGLVVVVMVVVVDSQAGFDRGTFSECNRVAMGVVMVGVGLGRLPQHIPAVAIGSCCGRHPQYILVIEVVEISG
jgi:hypothetical protein